MKTAKEMLTSGASPRQVYYWTERGFLKAHQEVPIGSGHSYTYDDSELIICERMARLVAGGVSVSVAEEVARKEGALVEIAPSAYVLVLDRGSVPHLEVYDLTGRLDEE